MYTESGFLVVNSFCCPTYSTVIFGDPTDEEESLASGVVTVVTTSDDKLAAVHKPG